MTTDRPPVVVLGIGNTLMADEGVGVHALGVLRERFALPPEVRVVDGGTAGMELLPEIEGARALIVIDAVRFGHPPASVVRLADGEVPAFFRTKLSPHQVGLSDLLATLALAGGLPERLVVVGVEPVSLELSTELTPAVAATLDRVVDMVAAELRGLGVSVQAKPQ